MKLTELLTIAASVSFAAVAGGEPAIGHGVDVPLFGQCGGVRFLPLSC